LQPRPYMITRLGFVRFLGIPYPDIPENEEGSFLHPSNAVIFVLNCSCYRIPVFKTSEILGYMPA